MSPIVWSIEQGAFFFFKDLAKDRQQIQQA